MYWHFQVLNIEMGLGWSYCSIQAALERQTGQMGTMNGKEISTKLSKTERDGKYYRDLYEKVGWMENY